ncbi:hypothetical protein RJ640_019505 [Escallonia rubra]|uniref:PDZ domain-containing protein n=1 Tax=Escallonia rubra TaxID=112253 RepID=A0AA88UNV9_9ASTE|nr:hypothetical protein RJ640_019505 [Escallonia rubra]
MAKMVKHNHVVQLLRNVSKTTPPLEDTHDQSISQSGTQAYLTGVGISIAYPTGNHGSAPGLVVISAAPGGPENRTGVSFGDLIMEIDDRSTEAMGIYDAAELLHGGDGETEPDTYVEEESRPGASGSIGSSEAIAGDGVEVAKNKSM